jgi:hypothetical protein
VVSDHGFEAGHQPFGEGTVSGTHRARRRSTASWSRQAARSPPVRASRTHRSWTSPRRCCISWDCRSRQVSRDTC